MKGHRTLTAAERRAIPLFPRLIATSFGAGFLPLAPGTWGAVVAVALWLPLYFFASPSAIFWLTFSVAFIYCIVGTWASGKAERYWGKDPVAACADETVGQWIALLPISGVDHTPWWMILLSLALFRFFDIFKPLGIRALEKLPGGFGMMADDILAAIYSAFILIVINLTIINP